MIRAALGAAALLAAIPLGAPLAAQDVPLPSAHGYEPQDELERGLWYEMAEQERLLKQSKFLVEDAALQSYVEGVLCRTVGEDRCGAARIYIVRTPQFNASMAPNGVMIVNTGLLMRMRDEAQLAAVLGHEFTHFEKQHSLRLFRSMRTKTDILSLVSMVPVPVAAMAGQFAIIGSVFSFSRDMEREADVGSVEELARAGYDPLAASTIWRQLGAELDATAQARGHRSQKDRNGGIFATHPRSTDRMEELAELARTQAAKQPGEGVRRAEEYRAALHDWWPRLIDDQIALQDFGGTEYLLQTLAGGPEGWTPELLYARGELYRSRGKGDDFAKAARFYADSVAFEGAPDAAWRGYGLSLMRMGARAEGREALQTYLARAPNAEDARMLAFMAGEPAR